jgi:hypothetical protein
MLNPIAQRVLDAYAGMPADDTVYHTIKVRPFIATTGREASAWPETTSSVTCNDGTTRTFQFGWSLTPDGSHAAHLSEFRDLTMLCLCPRSGKGPHLYPELDFSGIVGDFDSVWGLPDSAYPSCLRGLYAIGLTVNKMEHGYAWVAPEDYLVEIGDTSVLDALMTAGKTRPLSPEDIPAILATWYACSDCDGVECDGGALRPVRCLTLVCWLRCVFGLLAIATGPCPLHVLQSGCPSSGVCCSPLFLQEVYI